MINDQENKVGAKWQFPISSNHTVAKIHYKCCQFVILKVHLKANDAYRFVDSKANAYSNTWISGQRKAYLVSLMLEKYEKSQSISQIRN